MARIKKKRNKTYRGVDAAMDKPKITRISAVNRSRFGQWWFDRKKVVMPLAKTAGVILAAALIIIEIIQVLSGHTL